MGRPAIRPPKQLSKQVAMRRFLESATTDVGARDHIEPFAHIHAAFERWCSKQQVAPMGKITFARELGNAINYEEGDWDFRPWRVGSSQIRSWKGIKLRPIWKRFAEWQEEQREAEAKKPSVPTVILGPKRRPPRALVRRFLANSGIDDKDSVEPFTRLFDEFTKWCQYTGHWPLGRIAFAMKLRKAGLEPVMLGHKNQRAWRGFHIFTAQERQARWESPHWPFLAPGVR